MQDVQSPRPIINDTYAKDLMGDEGLAYWEAFKKHKNPNGANTARCYLIDTWIKEQLTVNPHSTVILIGAGLDSRAFRLKGGQWTELDEPGVIEYKNIKLPAAQCANPLQRIAIDFEKESLPDKLKSFTGSQSVIFVVEGVLMYLSNKQKGELFTTLTSMFPKHVLMCDLMNARFFNRIGKRGIHEELVRSGASFQDMLDDPEEFITGFGYKTEKMESNVITASNFGLIDMPKLIVKFLMKKTFMGYSSYQFRLG